MCTIAFLEGPVVIPCRCPVSKNMRRQYMTYFYIIRCYESFWLNLWHLFVGRLVRDVVKLPILMLLLFEYIDHLVEAD